MGAMDGDGRGYDSGSFEEERVPSLLRVPTVVGCLTRVDWLPRAGPAHMTWAACPQHATMAAGWR